MHTHQTALTQFIKAAGVRFAYRRFGKNEGLPLVFMMHFTGTMDHWDPAVTDAFARDREVILFNNAGISSSSGEVSTSVDEMARYAPHLWTLSASQRLIFWAFRLGVWWHSSLRSTVQNLFAALCSSVPARGVARGWRR